ncbi:oxidoreductase, short-chain dehydrogenase/reductase family [Aspergillus stella-maris]|uniref:oxidoreductase, short-chain dehydrogenase/reductase family n=1 Tax=Aspergillus stella-maris TaxID=1810926 RepID=UPI003CCE2D70
MRGLRSLSKRVDVNKIERDNNQQIDDRNVLLMEKVFLSQRKEEEKKKRRNFRAKKMVYRLSPPRINHAETGVAGPCSCSYWPTDEALRAVREGEALIIHPPHRQLLRHKKS